MDGMGKCKEALDYYQKSIKAKPDYPYPYLNLKRVLRRENYLPFVKEVIEFIAIVV
jgi:hypothetical protein